ncbi:cytochrome P450 [Polyplosphaeria fusca]|uniref:Cytochrome P450 n=1 Tax=Polyplosphaeria fusca TaxID=682080 RepID=A0A9P4QX47_9PLEO|nr:cytochrome P450 [Polyplosphaeria fusca]
MTSANAQPLQLFSMQWTDFMHNKQIWIALGVITHQIISSYESDHTFHIILPAWALFWTSSGVVEYTTGPSQSALEVLSTVGSSAALYFGALISSILIYRAFFHRLCQFPGPFFARLSKLYALNVTSKGPYYEGVDRLHQKYGSIVRTGPQELSIVDVDAISVLNSGTSKAKKSAWYDHSRFIEGVSLHTARDKTYHREIRKSWDKALGASSLRHYSPRINRHGTQLIDQLARRATKGEAVNISDWTNYYSGDVIGDIGFSNDFGMVAAGGRNELMKSMHDAGPLISYLNHISWCGNLILRTGNGLGAKPMVDFMQWAYKVLRHRKKNPPEERDIISWLLDPKDEDIPLNRNADARVMIAAGTDTTASTLTWLIYELCRNPQIQSRLYKDVLRVAGDKIFLDIDDIVDLPYLDDVINEGLRLHPAVCTGVPRVTPPEGLKIGNTMIPGNVNTWIPMYTLHRSPKYFAEPLVFEPERWSSKPEMVINKHAFIPFLTGPHKCVGWQLAMREMRSVVANLLLNFQVDFVEGDDGESVNRQAMDCFAVQAGPLNVKLTMRK